jgi:hypothetical protein
VLCEDNSTAMVYAYFGEPDDDVSEIDVGDIIGVSL